MGCLSQTICNIPRFSLLSIIRLTLGVLLTCFHSSVFSDTCQRLKVVGSDQWIPFAYIEGSEAKGIAYDVVRLISDDLMLAIEIQEKQPWRRLEKKMDSGQVDLLAGNYWNQQRAQKWAITDAISQDEVRVFVNKDHAFKFASLNDLIGREGVMPGGVSFGEHFDQFKSRLTISGITTHEQILAMLGHHRVDYAILPYFNTLRKLNNTPFQKQLIALSEPVSLNRVHLALSRKSPCFSETLLKRINTAISSRLQDGSIRKIEDSYLLTAQDKKLKSR
jgi:polar amino acid transport system substrate-binding protein